MCIRDRAGTALTKRTTTAIATTTSATTTFERQYLIKYLYRHQAHGNVIKIAQNFLYTTIDSRRLLRQDVSLPELKKFLLSLLILQRGVQLDQAMADVISQFLLTQKPMVVDLINSVFSKMVTMNMHEEAVYKWVKWMKLVNGHCQFTNYMENRIVLRNFLSFMRRSDVHPDYISSVSYTHLDVYKRQVIRKAIGKKGADVVFECSGAQPCIRTGIEVCKAGGTYVQVGMGQEEIQFPISKIPAKEITFQGSFRYCQGDYSDSIELVSSGKLSLKPLITRRYQFKEAIEAFDENRDHPLDNVKTIIEGPE